MTQAFNLSQLANNTNSSGQINADAAIYNTVNVANGGTNLTTIPAKSIPVANSADTYTTVTPAAGQSVRINAGNTAWEAFTPGTGTVTSVATGNGLSGGTITTTGTLTIAAPSFNSVGSYCWVGTEGAPSGTTTLSAGSTYSVGTGAGQIQARGNATNGNPNLQNILSGTWRIMSGTVYVPGCPCTRQGDSYAVRVA